MSEYHDQYALAIIRVETLLTESCRLWGDNRELSKRLMDDAYSVAGEWHMPTALCISLGQAARENVSMGR